MARTITMTVHENEWTTLGIDSASIRAGDTMEFRNELESGYGDFEGEWFAIAESVTLADGHQYHVLFCGTHGNDHSPMTSGNTFATLYRVDDPADMAEYAADVAEWESKPEQDPDAESPSDDDESPDDHEASDESADSTPAGWDAIDQDDESGEGA